MPDAQLHATTVLFFHVVAEFERIMRYIDIFVTSKNISPRVGYTLVWNCYYSITSLFNTVLPIKCKRNL